MTPDKRLRQPLLFAALLAAGAALTLIGFEAFTPRPDSRARGEDLIAIYAVIGAGVGLLVSLWAFVWTRLPSRADNNQETGANGD